MLTFYSRYLIVVGDLESIGHVYFSEIQGSLYLRILYTQCVCVGEWVCVCFGGNKEQEKETVCARSSARSSTVYFVSVALACNIKLANLLIEILDNSCGTRYSILTMKSAVRLVMLTSWTHVFPEPISSRPRGFPAQWQRWQHYLAQSLALWRTQTVAVAHEMARLTSSFAFLLLYVFQQSAGFWLFNVIFPPTAKPHTASNDTPPVIIGKTFNSSRLLWFLKLNVWTVCKLVAEVDRSLKRCN